MGTTFKNPNRYIYELTDHLGSVRALVTKAPEHLLSKTDYYPFGAVAKVWNNPNQTQEIYRYGYQGQYAEADSTTGWNAFELRMYDPLIGRWSSVDPERQYASSYVGMGNNPVSGFDPTGGKGFNQGVNSKGEIVFDDGLNDGNIFLVNDGFNDEINDLATLQANSTLIVENNVFVGDPMQLMSYISSTVDFVNADFTNILITTNFSKYEQRANGFHTSMGPLEKNSDGYTAYPLDRSNNKLTYKYIECSKDLILGNVYNLRNTITHENRHQYQIDGPMTFATYKEYKYYIESDAVEYQKSGRWWNSTTPEFKNIVNNYPNRFR